MTKRLLAFSLINTLILAAALVLGGCMSVPESRKAEQAIPVFPPPPDEPRFIYERSLYSSADIKPEESSADRFRRMATGEQTQGEGLSKPFGLAVRHGRLYVGDSASHAVMVFDIPAKRFFTIGEDDPGQLILPLGLTLDRQGNLYVVDSSAKKVMVYDREGKFLRSIGDPTWFHRPSGVAADADGRRVYVVDLGGVLVKEEHRVRVFDARTGNHLFDFGKRGTGPGEFNLPVDAAVAPDGSVYVVDGGNFRVQKFRDDGTPVSIFGAIGRQGGQFSRPKGLAVDKAGNVYVVDTAFGNFQIFSPQGQLLLAVGSRSEVDGPARYMLPSGIAVDDDGRVYVADQYFRKVDIYRPAALAPDDGYIGKKALDKKTPSEPGKRTTP
ncbi:MAG: hypothetical protein ACYC05_11840 [Sulfuricella sp.]|nr:6-bladed beta-propeller [Gammaproteobacteria bacterium]